MCLHVIAPMIPLADREHFIGGHIDLTFFAGLFFRLVGFIMIKLDTEKLAGWMEKGAKPSVTVKTLIGKYDAAPTESV